MDRFCDACLEDDEQVTAIGYCNHCEDFLCGDCIKFHRKNKVSKHHEILEGAAMPSEHSRAKSRRLDSNTTPEYEMCLVHSEENGQSAVIKFYCRAHDQVGCAECMVIDHRACAAEYIRDVCKEEEFTKEISEVHTVLKMLNTNLKTSKVKAQQMVEKNSEKGEKAIEDVQKFTSDVLTYFREREKKLVERVRERNREFEIELCDFTAKWQENETQINEIVGKLDTISGKDNKLFAFTKLKKAFITSKLKQSVLDLEGSVNTTNDRNYIFEPNATLTEMLTNAKQTSLGRVVNLQKTASDAKSDPDTATKTRANVKQTSPDRVVNVQTTATGVECDTSTVIETHANVKQASPGRVVQATVVDTQSDESMVVNDHTTTDMDMDAHTKTNTINASSAAIADDADKAATSKLPQTLLKFEHIRDINIACQLHRKSQLPANWATGIVQISPFTLVVANYYAHKIVAVNTSQSPRLNYNQNYCQLGSNPYDLAILSKSMVAVTTPHALAIELLSVKEVSVSKFRTIKTRNKCYGVDFSVNKGLLLVTYASSKLFDLINVEGCVIHTINVKEIHGQMYPSGFNIPSIGAIFANSGEEILVANTSESKVTRLSIQDGYTCTVLDSYVVEGMENPTGLCLSTNGSFIVCANNTVKIISKEGKLLGIIQNDNPEESFRPIAVAALSKKIYITNGYQKYVKVYQLIESGNDKQ